MLNALFGNGTRREQGDGDAQQDEREQAKREQVLQIGDKVWYWKNASAIEADIQHIDRREEDQWFFTLTPTQRKSTETSAVINTPQTNLEKFSLQWPAPVDADTQRKSGPFVVNSMVVYTTDSGMLLNGIVTEVKPQSYQFTVIGEGKMILTMHETIGRLILVILVLFSVSVELTSGPTFALWGVEFILTIWVLLPGFRRLLELRKEKN